MEPNGPGVAGSKERSDVAPKSSGHFWSSGEIATPFTSFQGVPPSTQGGPPIRARRAALSSFGYATPLVGAPLIVKTAGGRLGYCCARFCRSGGSCWHGRPACGPVWNQAQAFRVRLGHVRAVSAEVGWSVGSSGLGPVASRASLNSGEFSFDGISQDDAALLI